MVSSSRYSEKFLQKWICTVQHSKNDPHEHWEFHLRSLAKIFHPARLRDLLQQSIFKNTANSTVLKNQESRRDLVGLWESLSIPNPWFLQKSQVVVQPILHMHGTSRGRHQHHAVCFQKSTKRTLVSAQNQLAWFHFGMSKRRGGQQDSQWQQSLEGQAWWAAWGRPSPIPIFCSTLQDASCPLRHLTWIARAKT